jgi:secreted PhoX family phosphatase
VNLTSKSISRRNFLKGAASVAAGAAALPALNGLGLLGERGRVLAAPGDGSYGPLAPTPDLRDGVARLALPEGFQYRSFGVAGETMSDGNLTPLAHDGMAVFNMPDGRFRLVRNHEDRNGPNAGSVGGPEGTKYDAAGGGGTTTLVINPFTRELERDFISLNGTIVNCAGGETPWGSWVTCEETNAGAPPWQQQHGYCFEVPASANGPVVATPIPEMGRFAHEALAVDPNTGYVYETEDSGSTSGFYRYIPNVPGQLSQGGQLQMLAVDGMPNYSAITGQTVGAPLPVVWVPIADPNPPGTDSEAVYNQGAALGGARFARLEGIWYGNGAFYINSTSGGDVGEGQVWEYRPTGPDTGTLTLVFESPSSAVLDAPDNITVSPQGALLLCEDGGGEQYLRGITQAGGIFDFALNLWNDDEWAGACFADASPSWNARPIRGDNPPLGGRWDRITLFVNLFGTSSGPTPPADETAAGMTVAIWGPWQQGAL